jgi:hypothetical protein
VWFASSKEGNSFTCDKFKNKGCEYLEKMKVEIEELRVEALTNLKKQLPLALSNSGMQKNAYFPLPAD